MEEQNANAAVETTEPTAQGAGTTGSNQPDYRSMYEQLQSQFEKTSKDAESWKKRTGNLQGEYQKLKESASAYQARISELEEQFGSMSDERSTLLEKVTQFEALQSQHDRMKLIASKFPDLLQMEADGLLPNDSGEELEKKLTAIRNHLGTKEKLDTQKMAAGAVSPPAGSPPKAGKDLMSAAIAAFKSGKMEEYTQLSNEFYQQKQGE